MGNAKSLRGDLPHDPSGADGQVLRHRPGQYSGGRRRCLGGGAKVTVNHLRPDVFQREPASSGSADAGGETGPSFTMSFPPLISGPFRKWSRRSTRRHRQALPGAVDGRQICSRPGGPGCPSRLPGRIENLELTPAVSAAKVVVNPRTGSVVMNQTVTLDSCRGCPRQPLGGGGRATGWPGQGTATDIQVKQDNGSLMTVRAGANLAEVVKALNALGPILTCWPSCRP